jgi:hypothetical protein
MATPVPVEGPPTDLLRLEGEWVGEYSSRITGREGSLTFDLTAEEERAFGEVWMIVRPPNTGPPYEVRGAPMVRPLTIEFVRVEGGFISGMLDPYLDPLTGCSLITTFRGRMDGDRIYGTFVTENESTGEWSAGEWRAERKSGRPAARQEP